jgi:large subunit ribosomal protein L25
MATVKLQGQTRSERGKQAAKRVRAKGRIPAVLYGEEQENVPLSIDAHDLRVALSTPSGRNVIIQLGMDGGDEVTRAVIREMDRDPVTREIVHVDLQRISENKPVIMHVPLTLSGESLAVKEGRGILDHTMRELEVKCLPKDIPERIEVDISGLEVKHAIHVRDIEVADVEILDHPDRPVVEILQPTIYAEEVEAEEAAAEEAEEGAEPAEGEEGAPAAEESKEEKSKD